MRAFADAGAWLWEIDDVTLRWAAQLGGADPAAVVAERAAFAATATLPGTWPGPLPRALHELCERVAGAAAELRDFERLRAGRTEAAPLGPRPEPSTIADCGLWTDELADVEALLALDYARLDAGSVTTLVDVAHNFLPAEVIRYFAPAIAEHAGDLGDEYELEKLVAGLARALPLPAGLAGGLRRALRGRGERPRFGLRAPGDWRRVDGDGPGFAKLLLLIAQLDPGPLTRALFASTDPLLALSVIEHDHAVSTAGWRAENPSATDLYSDGAITRRLQHLERSLDAEIATLASEVLEARLTES